MSRIINMILNQFMKVGASRLENSGPTLTPEQKAAQKRVRKVMRATRRMNRI
jgi:hypothetical protein